MALIVGVAAITLIVAAALSMWLSSINSLYIPSVSNIRTVGVKAFWDINLANEIEEIQWGTIYAGESKNVSIYLKSVSNVETTLEIEATNWTFRSSDNSIVQGPSEVSLYLTLTWDYNNVEVAPSEAIYVTLTLSADGSSTFIQFLADNKVDQFSFDITIRSVE